MNYLIIAVYTMLLCGCAGIVTTFAANPEVCTKDCQILGFSDNPDGTRTRELRPATKANILALLKEPDEIKKGNDEEIWVYSKSRWVGVTIFLIVPLPLMLPLGSSEIEATFSNSDLVSLKTTNINSESYVCYFIPAGGNATSLCFSEKLSKNYLYH